MNTIDHINDILRMLQKNHRKPPPCTMTAGGVWLPVIEYALHYQPYGFRPYMGTLMLVDGRTGHHPNYVALTIDLTEPLDVASAELLKERGDG